MDIENEVITIKKNNKERRCSNGCGTILNMYNTSKFCYICKRKMQASGKEKVGRRKK